MVQNSDTVTGGWKLCQGEFVQFEMSFFCPNYRKSDSVDFAHTFLGVTVFSAAFIKFWLHRLQARSLEGKPDGEHELFAVLNKCRQTSLQELLTLATPMLVTILFR